MEKIKYIVQNSKKESNILSPNGKSLHNMNKWKGTLSQITVITVSDFASGIQILTQTADTRFLTHTKP